MRLSKLFWLTGLISVHLSAFGCGGGACEIDEEACGLAYSGLPFLNPANDTRVNLLLLVSEQNGLALPEQNRLPANSLENALSGYGIFASHRQQHQTPVLNVALAKNLSISDALMSQAQSSVLPSGRCISNNVDSANSFLQALSNDSNLSATQRTALATLRLNMLGLCDNDTLSVEVNDVELTSATNAYLSYLQGAQSFYYGDFERASDLFTELSHSEIPWLKETSIYMLARSRLNWAQTHAADAYGFFDRDKTNRQLLTQTKELLKNYLDLYPKGQYADSANGLYRRVYWMQADRAALANAFEQALNNGENASDLITLLYEVDNKLLEDKHFLSANSSATLTMVQDLKRLRDNLYLWPSLQADELVAQNTLFADSGKSEWFDYLQLSFNLYQKKDYVSILNTVAPLADDESLNTMSFSRQVLRGLALDSLKRYKEAQTHWRKLLARSSNYEQNQYLQLALTVSLVQDGQTDSVFLQDSPITSLRYRLPLLIHVASKDLLQQQMKNESASKEERKVALYILLLKTLSSGQYQDYLTNIAYIDTLTVTQQESHSMSPLAQSLDLNTFRWDGINTTRGYACNDLPTIAKRLSENSQDGHALNCLGEFFLSTYAQQALTNYPQSLIFMMKGKTEFKGKLYSRLDLYLKVIQDPKSEAEDKSYALYRAINCFATVGINRCGNQDISLQQRRSWFISLKNDYKNSPWAKKLRYYW